MIPAQYEPLPAGPFDLLVADPPWRFASNSEARPGRNAMGKYACMTLPQLKAMGDDIRAVCAPDAVCILWTLNSMLPHALELLDAWGFKFSTSGHWAKIGANGKQAFGSGLRLRGAGEPFILGVRGRPKTTKVVRSVIIGPRRAHSQKPDESFREFERLMPDARRLELFSRTDRPGWTAWGNEAGTIPLQEKAA